MQIHFGANMDKRQLFEFKENVDSWIKQFNERLNGLEKMYKATERNIDNIQTNYELIYELKDEIEDLKRELNNLKLIQIISLKKKKNEIPKMQ